MALSQKQLDDMRADLGISETPAVFGDEELNRLYERTASNYEAAIVLGLEQIIASAVKFYDYTANASKEEVSQIFEHLKEVLAMKKARLSSTKSQFKLVKIKGGSAQIMDKPDGYE
jgi:ElaB/YqjD/DUF883 family membrane-anchored ribosome-binding protein